jgi:hypothetical protein
LFSGVYEINTETIHQYSLKHCVNLFYGVLKMKWDIFKGIEIVIHFIFPCRTLFGLDVEVQVAVAMCYPQVQGKYEDFDTKVKNCGSFQKQIY